MSEVDMKKIERLARAACVMNGMDPDHFPAGSGPFGLYGRPLPWFAPDAIIRPWHKYVDAATNYFAFHQATTEI